MSKTRRIINVLIGLLMIVGAILLMLIPEFGYIIIIMALGIGMAVSGIKKLVNSYTLSRGTVEASRLFYDGILYFDIGIFSACLINMPVFFLMLYLCGVYLFSGVIDIMSAIDAKKLESAHYKFKLLKGIVNVAVGILCLVFITRAEVVLYIYCGGLIFNAILRIINSFRKTALVYEEVDEASIEAME